MVCAVLRELADVQPGYTFRSGVVDDPTGTTTVIQMKDLGDDNLVRLSSLARVAAEVPEVYGARKDDVLLRSRGDKVTSAIVAQDPPGTVVAAPLLRIRVTTDAVLPEYLNWFINQPPAQAHLARHNEGSYVKMLRRQAVCELEVDVPPLDRQEAIARLAGLSARERMLNAEIGGLRDRMLADIMLAYAQGGPTE